MRKFFIYTSLLFVIISISCSRKVVKEAIPTATISASLNNDLHDTVLLYSNYHNSIDSLFIKNGEGTINLNTDNYSLGYLYYQEKEFPLFLHEGDSIILTQQNDSIVTIVGGTEYKKYNEFLISYKDSINKEELVTKYIKENPFFSSTIYILKKYLINTDTPNINLIKEFITNLPGVIQDKYYLETYDSKLTRAGRSKENSSALYFNVKSLKGDNKDLSHIKNKFTLMTFWASWDSLSISENRKLIDLHKVMSKYKDFKMYNISLDNDTTQLKKIVKREKYLWEQLYDLQGIEATIADRYGVNQLPTYFIINKNNRIIYRTNSVDSITKNIKKLYDTDIKKK